MDVHILTGRQRRNTQCSSKARRTQASLGGFPVLPCAVCFMPDSVAEETSRGVCDVLRRALIRHRSLWALPLSASESGEALNVRCIPRAMTLPAN